MNTKTLTIAEHEFTVSQPYLEGHVVTEAEAKALNQVRAENIRNNMASKVKIAFGEAPTDEINPSTIEALVAAYDADYIFTLASVGAGKRPTDPVEVEAIKIARGFFSDFCEGKGITVKAAREKLGEDAYQAKLAEIALRDNVVKEAKRRVKSRLDNASAALADMGLDDLVGATEEVAA